MISQELDQFPRAIKIDCKKLIQWLARNNEKQWSDPPAHEPRLTFINAVLAALSFPNTFSINSGLNGMSIILESNRALPTNCPRTLNKFTIFFSFSLSACTSPNG